RIRYSDSNISSLTSTDLSYVSSSDPSDSNSGNSMNYLDETEQEIMEDFVESSTKGIPEEAVQMENTFQFDE
ncbi:11057_t:CDS:2, partial [Ambispora gerdemannii]